MEEGIPFNWDEAFARHSRTVLVALLARRIPLDRAGDLAQEAWARLIARHRAGRLAQIELPGLAVRQALFLASDARRRDRFHEPVLEAGADAPSLTDRATSIEDRLLTQELLQRALRALEAYPPRGRQVFLFVHAHPGMRHDEAAAHLGMSVQRLRQTLCEVRQHLRTSVEDPA
jgi:RNA polymerase sigma factor (sigma-70 family)